MMAITKREHGHNGHACDLHSIALPQRAKAWQTLVHWIHHPSLAFILKAPLSSMLVIACPPPHTWLSPFALSPYKLLCHLCLWFLVQLLILNCKLKVKTMEGYWIGVRSLARSILGVEGVLELWDGEYEEWQVG